MNWVDIIIVLVAIGYAFSGFSQGVIRTVIGLIGLIAGIYLAGQFYPQVAATLFGSNQSWGPVIAWVIVFVVVNVAASVIGWVLSRVVKAVLLGWVDKLVGLAIGAIVGLLTCAALLAVVMKYLPATEATIAGSGLATFLLDKFPLVLGLLPSEFGSIKDFFAAPRAS
ncbi:MAG: CvpA family protein [Chloroflexota bacterium]